MTLRHIAFALIAVAVVVALLVRRVPDAVVADAPGAAREVAATSAVNAASAVPAKAKDTVAPVESSSDPALETFTEKKYEFLLAGLHQSIPAEQLHGLLRDRERLAVAINTARQSNDESMHMNVARDEAALAQADLRIRSLLHPTDYAAYEALRDSDVERFQLEDYAGGIGLVAPLSDAEQRAILLSKLNHKKAFRQTLLDSGLLSPDLLSPHQRKQAYSHVSTALTQYHDNYLAEARQYLRDDEQYTLLRNYESAEFAAELAMLRSIAGEG